MIDEQLALKILPMHTKTIVSQHIQVSIAGEAAAYQLSMDAPVKAVKMAMKIDIKWDLCVVLVSFCKLKKRTPPRRRDDTAVYHKYSSSNTKTNFLKILSKHNFRTQIEPLYIFTLVLGDIW